MHCFWKIKLLTIFTLIFVIFTFNAVSQENLYDEFAEFDTPKQITNDPYEKINRKIFSFNEVVDKNFAIPIAKGYFGLTSPDFRAKIRNTISNLYTPYDVIISTTQADYQSFAVLSWRFIINSTLGLLGIFDVASELGLKPIQKNFSDSLALYGFSSGSYIVVPFMGPSFTRSVIDLPMSIAFTGTLFSDNQLPISMRFVSKETIFGEIIMSPKYTYLLFSLNIIDKRASLLGLTNDLDETSTDKYKAYRDMYFQFSEFSLKQRLELIKNGIFKKEDRVFYEITPINMSNFCLVEIENEDCGYKFS